jgi:hypothetical protein
MKSFISLRYSLQPALEPFTNQSKRNSRFNDMPKYYTMFSLTQLSSLLLTSTIGARCSGVFKPSSSGRLKTPKHVVPIIDVNNKELR